MALIVSDYDSFNTVQTKLKESDGIILQNLAILNKELGEISDVLSTPQSSKIIPEQIKYLNETETTLKARDEYFYNVLEIAKSVYGDTYKTIKASVGDKNA